MKRLLPLLAASIILCGCTSADFARSFGRRDTLNIQLVIQNTSKQPNAVRVKLIGFLPAFPMAKQRVLAEQPADERGRVKFEVPPYFLYNIEIGEFFGPSGWCGYRHIKRADIPRDGLIPVEITWREDPDS